MLKHNKMSLHTCGNCESRKEWHLETQARMWRNWITPKMLSENSQPPRVTFCMIHLHGHLEMTKLQKWRADKWRLGRQGLGPKEVGVDMKGSESALVVTETLGCWLHPSPHAVAAACCPSATTGQPGEDCVVSRSCSGIYNYLKFKSLILKYWKRAGTCHSLLSPHSHVHLFWLDFFIDFYVIFM